MISSIVIYMILALCLLSLLLAEGWATEKKSRSFSQALSGSRTLSVLCLKLLFGCLIFLLGYECCIHFTTIDERIFDPNWSNAYSFAVTPLAMLALVFGYSTAARKTRRPVNLAGNISLLVIYFLLRVLFLLLYEYFFRGVLLFICIEAVGIVIAILINLSVYAMTHAYSDRREIIGTIPFGLTLCSLTILLHSVWPAIFIHLALAISHEIRLLSNHPFTSTKSVKL